MNGDVLYVLGKNDPELQNKPVSNTCGVAPGKPVLYLYNFTHQSWRSQRLPDSPAIGHGSLLAMHGRQLIVYGTLLFRFPSYSQNCSQASSKCQRHSSST